MAQTAYVILSTDGRVLRTHRLGTDFEGNVIAEAPTAGDTDVSTLLKDGFLAERECPLAGGNILLVLKKL